MGIKFGKAYMEISIPVIKRIAGPLPFDIYIKRTERAFTKLFKKGDIADQERLDHYWTQKNVDSLYVKNDNYRNYLDIVKDVAETFIDDKEISSAELLSVSKEMIDVTMVEVFVDLNVDQDSLSHASTAVKGCVTSLEKDPKSMITLFKHITSHPYLMKHSITTSILSIILAKMEEMTSKKTLNFIGMGGLLHDIGLSHLSFDAEEKDQIHLSPSEWKELKEHPQIGKRMLDGLKAVPNEVIMIVLHHHEQPNGRGYPNGLYDKSIFFPAKIIAIADSFSNLITKRSYRDAFPPKKALEIMKLDHGKYDANLLKLFSTLFSHLKK